VLQKLIVIGEAAANLSPDLKARHPHIPWRAIVAFRKVMVHAYFSVQRALLGFDLMGGYATVDDMSELVRPVKPKQVYLDVCALCRPFDDQQQVRLRLETNAVELKWV